VLGTAGFRVRCPVSTAGPTGALRQANWLLKNGLLVNDAHSRAVNLLQRNVVFPHRLAVFH